MRSIFWSLLTMFFVTYQIVYGLEIHEHFDNSFKTHQHGTSELTLVFEDKSLEIRIQSPTVNMLGFEHRAKNLEDRDRVQRMKSLLKSPQNFFTFVGVHCSLVNSNVSWAENAHFETSEHESVDGENQYYESHSEIVADYLFRCDETSLRKLSVNLFDLFPGIENIRAMWVTKSEQGVSFLNTEKRLIDLR